MLSQDTDQAPPARYRAGWTKVPSGWVSTKALAHHSAKTLSITHCCTCDFPVFLAFSHHTVIKMKSVYPVSQMWGTERWSEWPIVPQVVAPDQKPNPGSRVKVGLSSRVTRHSMEYRKCSWEERLADKTLLLILPKPHIHFYICSSDPTNSAAWFPVCGISDISHLMSRIEDWK